MAWRDLTHATGNGCWPLLGTREADASGRRADRKNQILTVADATLRAPAVRPGRLLTLRSPTVSGRWPRPTLP